MFLGTSSNKRLQATISDKILWEFQKVCLKFYLSPYTMLRIQNLAWHKFYSLFLNIVKGGGKERRETQSCLNSSFSHNFITDCLQNLQSFKCGILKLFILNQVEDMHLNITSLLYKCQ